MQLMAVPWQRGRIAIMALALLVSVGFSSVAAAAPEMGLTECDQAGCARGYATGNASFQVVSVIVWTGNGNFISNAPLGMGFTQ